MAIMSFGFRLILTNNQINLLIVTESLVISNPKCLTMNNKVTLTYYSCLIALSKLIIRKDIAFAVK